MKGRHYVSLMISFEPLEPPKGDRDGHGDDGASAWRKNFTEVLDNGEEVEFVDFPAYILPDSPEAEIWKRTFLQKTAIGQRAREARRQV